MAHKIKPDELAGAISETLEAYRQDVYDAVDKTAGDACEELVQKTRQTAPVGKRNRYRKMIAHRPLKKSVYGVSHVWYVKAPEYRLTHLLVHGHATRNGGRTKPDPFLQNALDDVLPQYEANLKEAIEK